MARYRVRWDYRAGDYAWTAGTIVELDDETAAHIQRDSPGVLEAETESAERDIAEPIEDRMVRRGRRRGESSPSFMG